MTKNITIRILLIEDDEHRAKRLQNWLPDNVICVWVKSAGRAIGLLRRDRGRVYAGILLDHDLQLQKATSVDNYLSGSNIVDIIIQTIDRTVPVLVHSMNESRAPVMADKLKNAGFKDILQIPMSSLTRRHMSEWMEEVHELWEIYSE